MVTLSTKMQNAIAAGAPQRFMLEFPDSQGRYGASYVTIFSNEEISVSAGVRMDAAFNSDQELTIGSCPSTEIQFTLLNDKRQLENFNFGECKAYMGVKIEAPATSQSKNVEFDDGLYEFIDLGTFIVTKPDIIQKDMLDISANDRMTLFDKEMPSQTALGVTFPTTIDGLLSAMCSYIGVAVVSHNYLNHDLAVTKWPKEFENKTMRDVLKWIAEAAGSIARFNRAGRLEWVWFTPVSKVFDENNYKEFTQTWYTAGAITGLKVRNAEESAESSYGSSDNPYIIAGNPFLR